MGNKPSGPSYLSTQMIEAGSQPMWIKGIEYVELENHGSKGLGISVIDSQEPFSSERTVIIIKSLVQGGVAEQDGRLKPGDRLMSVNGTKLEHSSLKFAVQVLKGIPQGNISIGVAKPYLVAEHYEEKAGSDVTEEVAVAASLHDELVDSETTNNLKRQADAVVAAAAEVEGEASDSEESSKFDFGPPLLFSGDSLDVDHLPESVKSRLETITIRRQVINGKLGITLNGDEDGCGCVIKSVMKGGAVGIDNRVGLGDRIISVNDQSMIGLNGHQARSVLRKESLHQDIVITFVKAENKLDLSTQKSPSLCLDDSLSSPIGIEHNQSGSQPSGPSSLSAQMKEAVSQPMWNKDIEFVELENQGSKGLGISVIDSQEPFSSERTVIIIKSLVQGGVAEKDGRLKPGDRLMYVSGTKLEHSSLEFAVQVLKGIPQGNISIGVAKPYQVAEHYEEEAGSDVTQEVAVATSLHAELVDSETTNKLNRQADAVVAAAGEVEGESSDSASSESEESSKFDFGPPLLFSGDSLDVDHLPESVKSRLETITIRRQMAGKLGITLKGDEDGCGCVIKYLMKGGAVGIDNRVGVGDRIISVNDQSMIGLNGHQARSVLRKESLHQDIVITFVKAENKLDLSTQKSPSLCLDNSLSFPIGLEHDQTGSQGDQHISKLRKDKEKPLLAPEEQQVLKASSGLVLHRSPIYEEPGARVVELNRMPDTGLGICIIGGNTDLEGLGLRGIYIIEVLQSSPAGRLGMLSSGDQILEVDGHDLRQATHDEAEEIIRHAKNPVRFVVKSTDKDKTSFLDEIPTVEELKYIPEYEKDMQHHKKCINIAKQMGDKVGEGRAYGNLGLCYYYLEQYEIATHHHEKHLNIAKQIEDKAGEGRAHNNLGLCYYSLGEYDKAIYHYERDLKIAKRFDDKKGEGHAYNNIGLCCYSFGLYDKAIQHHEKHLDIAKQTGDKAGEGHAYGNIGLCYTSLGEYNKAILHHEEHLNMAKQIGDKAGEGHAFNNLGLCYYSLGEYCKGIDHHERYLNIAKQIADKKGEGRAHNNLGLCYNSFGLYDKAIKHHEKHLHIAKQIGDKVSEECAYTNLGLLYRSLGEYEKAKQHHEKQLNIAKQLGDKAGEGRAYANLGLCFDSLKQYGKAIQHHEKDLIIAQQIGDKSSEVRAYDNLCLCYKSLGLYGQAIQHHDMQLNITKQIGDKEGEGCAYENLGFCFKSVGQYEKAILHHEKHLDIAKLTEDKEGEGRAYSNLGNCYDLLGQYNKAIKHHEKHLDIAKLTEDKEGEGCAYGNIGLCYRSLGQYDKAIQNHEKDLRIAKQIENKAGEGRAYNNRGICYYFRGQYDKAKQDHEKYLKIIKQIGDKATRHHEENMDVRKQTRVKTGEGCAFANLGLSYHSLGDYNKTIQYHEKHLNIAQQCGDKAGQGCAYTNLGLCYHSLGMYEQAKRHHNEHLKIAKQIGSKSGEGCAYNNLGNCFYSLGNHEAAINHHEMYLCIAKEIGDKAGEGRAYGNLGLSCYSLEQYDKAILYHKMYRNIAKYIKDKAGQGRAYGNLGLCYYSLEQYDKAIQHQEKYRNIAEQIGDKAGEGCASGDLCLCYERVGQYHKAEINGRKCISCYEGLWKYSPQKDEYKISYRDKFAWRYRSLTRVLITQSRTNEALVIIEKGRSRALAELMLDSYFFFPVELREGPFIFNINDIREVVAVLDVTVLFLSLDDSELYFWVIQPSGDVEFKKHSHKLDMEKLDALISNARGAPREFNCEDRSLAFLYPDELVEQTELKSAWSPSATLENVSECLSRVIKRESKHMTVSVTSPAKRCLEEEEEEEEEPRVNPFSRLYKIVLGPVQGLIKGSQVVIVPEGQLSLVPYAALKDDKGRYVAEYLQVRLVPSLATAKMMRDYPQQPDSGARPLIIGDPDAGMKLELPYARIEAVMIGQLLNVQPLVGKEATKEKVLQCIENANLIHIAAHGDMKRGEILLAVNHEKRITRSNIADFMLMMSDLENKCLKAKLVVLSCCHSARGEVTSEGIIGVARAFLGAGARSVLVALWAIEDEATLKLMTLFYEYLKSGKKTNESLSLAMKTIRGTTQFCDPMYWAPFFIIGDDVSIF